MKLIGRPADDFKKKEEKSKQHKLNLGGVLSVLQTAQKHGIALSSDSIDMNLLEVQGSKGGIYQMSLSAKRLVEKLKEEAKEESATPSAKRKRDDDEKSEDKAENKVEKKRKNSSDIKVAEKKKAPAEAAEAPKKKKKKVVA